MQGWAHLQTDGSGWERQDSPTTQRAQAEAFQWRGREPASSRKREEDGEEEQKSTFHTLKYFPAGME